MTSKTIGAGKSISPTAAARPELRELRTQFARFLVVGTLAVVVDFGVYRGLAALGIPTYAAKAISYAAGVVVGFLGNKLWAFESQRHFLPELLMHTLLYAGTLLVNVAVNAGLMEWLGTERALLAFLGATAVTTLLNFVGMRWVTFRKGVAARRGLRSLSS